MNGSHIHSRIHPVWQASIAACLASLCLCVTAGCDSTSAYYSPNQVEMELRDLNQDDPQSEKLRSEIADTLLALFGDPDAPNIFEKKEPIDGEAQSPLEKFGFDSQLLNVAAGPAYNDKPGVQHGLYRLHCAHCHGVTGDGNGPTAPFLNPYPRDYRPGKFKFKSTFGSAKPTRDDLKRILKNGIPGTAMPSFVLLPDNELDALVEYVRYLAIRGETELRLISYAADEDSLPEGGIAEIAGGFPLEMEEGIPSEEPEYENTVASIVYSWDSAVTQVVQPVTPYVPIITQSSDSNSKEVQESIDRGRELFYSAATKCATCHGDSAQGDGDLTNYDDWIELIYKPPGVNVGPDHEAHMLALGAPPLRNIRPRNLRLGVFRGGRRPIDIYRRIFSGIHGSKMPAQGVEAGLEGDEVSDEDAGGALKRQEIWDLVNYVLSLRYEPLSMPPKDAPGLDTTLR